MPTIHRDYAPPGNKRHRLYGGDLFAFPAGGSATELGRRCATSFAPATSPLPGGVITIHSKLSVIAATTAS